MKMLKCQVLRGPNIWSIHRHRLVVIHLDLEEMRDVLSSDIPGFHEALVAALPSLEEHCCSPGCAGGFLERVREGTLMSHVIEHVALELQVLAGMPVSFGRTRESTTPGVYRVVFQYQHEAAGRHAATAALRMIEHLLAHGAYPRDALERDLQHLRAYCAEAALGPSTEAIVREAAARDIPWTILPADKIIQLGQGARQRRIQAAQTDHTGTIAVEAASDKARTIALLRKSCLPVPEGRVVDHRDNVADAIAAIGGFPVVLKPVDGNQGRGITTDVGSLEEAASAYERARMSSRAGPVLVERYHRGRDFRVLVVDGKVVAAAERVPAHVVGDGTSTIAALIEAVNRDPRRGEGHEMVLTRITLDAHSEQVLARQGHGPDRVPARDEIVYLKATANLSTGGTAIDRTGEIHAHNVWLAERAARIMGLDIAGIDMISPAIDRPLREVDGVIVEVNAAPGLRMHLQPSAGQPRNVAAPIVDMLFPAGSTGRIPITAVTGTNGKTTTTRLIAHLLRHGGQVVGYTTSDGTYIGDHLVESGDNTGPHSARLVLDDPTVEVAVLETARGGLLRAGLGFDQCTVGVVLNVTADHLGLEDIHSPEEMARVKSVVAESVTPGGHAVLNADDALVRSIARRLTARVAYFSMNSENIVLRDEVRHGGVGAVYDGGYLCLLTGQERIPVEHVENIPLTLGGQVPCMIANALAASLAAYVQGVRVDHIRTALRGFRPSVAQSRGRMNLIPMGDFHVLLDYAHNPAAYEALSAFTRTWSAGERIGVIGIPGDRLDADMRAVGAIATGMFDRVIIKEDDDRRGRAPGETAALVHEGLRRHAPDFPAEIILDEAAALAAALARATPGSLVVFLPEHVDRALHLLARHGMPAIPEDGPG